MDLVREAEGDVLFIKREGIDVELVEVRFLNGIVEQHEQVLLLVVDRSD